MDVGSPGGDLRRLQGAQHTQPGGFVGILERSAAGLFASLARIAAAPFSEKIAHFGSWELVGQRLTKPAFRAAAFWLGPRASSKSFEMQFFLW